MPQTYTFASWNVNGLRAVLKRTRALSRSRKNSTSISWRCKRPSCKKARSILTCPAITKPGATPSVKGYSGTAVFSRQKPLRVLHADALLPYTGEGEAAALVTQAVTEGRVCALEFDKFWFVDVYTPTRKTNSPASTCAWLGTMPIAAF